MNYYQQRLNSRITLLPAFDRIRDKIIALTHQCQDWEAIKKEATNHIAVFETHGIEDYEDDNVAVSVYVNDDDCSEVLQYVNGQRFIKWLAKCTQPKPEWLQQRLMFEALKCDQYPVD